MQSGEECACGARVWLPLPGPQTKAASSRADVLAIGGGVFGGKSTLIHMILCRWVTRRNFSGIVFRREAVMFKGAGSLWQKSREFYPGLGGRPREAPAFDWRFPGGGILSFSGLERVEDWNKHEGNEYAVIVFDEAHQFEREQVLQLMQRNRTPAGYDGPCRMILTFNPPKVSDPGYELIRNELLDWYIDVDGWPIPERSGVLRYFTVDNDAVVWVDKAWRDEDGIGPTSFTFVPMLIDDNPIGVAKNPRYRAKIRAQTHVEQQRKLKGNFNVQSGDSVFSGGGVRWIDGAELARLGLKRQIRYWDQATTPKERAKAGHSATASARGNTILCPVCAGWRYLEEATGEACDLCNPGGFYPRSLAIELAEEFGPRELFVCTHYTEGYGGPGQVEQWHQESAQMDGAGVPIYIEQMKAVGALLIHNYAENVLKGYNVHGDPLTGAKALRADPLVALGEAGLWLVVRGDWDANLTEAVSTFTLDGKGKHVDLIDCSSGLYAACLRHEWPVDLAWTFT